MKKIFRLRLVPALIILAGISVLNSPGGLTPTLYPLANQPNGLAVSGNNLYVTTDVSSDNFFFVFTSDGLGDFSPTGPANTSTGSGTDNPMGAMTVSGSTLYGTGNQGSSDANGCVFAVNTDGSGFAVLHTFGGGDGSGPNGGLVPSGNLLYGTTSGGGDNSDGTVFAIATDGSFTNLYSFTGGGGAKPLGGLVLSGNTLYGTTATGGVNNDGTLFAIKTDGTGFTNLYTFTATRANSSEVQTNGDGANPQAGLFLWNNMLYGTTSAGGANGDGTIFAVKMDGPGYTVLHTFKGSDGYAPHCAPVLAGDTLYGVTSNSTALGCIFFGVKTNGLGFTNLDSGFVTGQTGGLVALSGTTDTTLFGMGASSGSVPVVFAFTLNVVTSEPLVVTTTSLPDATNGAAYNQTLAVTGGKPPYHWTNILSAIPRGLKLATNGIISGTPTTNGLFNLTVKVTDSQSATATQALALTIVLVDTTPPVLSITNVTSGMQVSNSTFKVKGTARDNVAVAGVSNSLNNAAWTPATTANQWTNWSATVTLSPGTNSFAAYAVDISGNRSPTTNVSLFLVVTNQLRIRTTGLGKISPNYSNAWLSIGRNYSITSSPAAGFVFSNWIISTNWLGGTTVGKTNLLFMMASNLTLEANFLDVYRPTNTIIAPTAGQHMTNALATVVGTAKDNWGLTGVWYQLNNGVWNITTSTNGWTNWTTTVELISGTNTLKTYAADLGGNFSLTNSVSVVSSNTFKLQLAFTNAVPLKANGLTFTLQLSSGLNGHIQVSSNLTHWTTLTNFVGTNSTLTFHDPAATNSSHRFYRATIP